MYTKRISVRAVTTVVQLAALLFWVVPVESLAAGPQGRLEGLLLDVDGRPASGHRVHLIDDRGSELGRSEVGEDGLYSFKQLAPGDYSLGIESPDGAIAVVAAPPIRLEERELARRDLKLVEADAAAVNQAVKANHGFSIWWHSLPTVGKVWTIVAVVAAAGLTYEAFHSEGEGSRFVPEN